MKWRSVGVIVVIAGAIGGAWYYFASGARSAKDIEYRFAPVTRGELVRSTSANGQLVALTTVDVKSKAGGKVVKLAVEEGTRVKKGDLIALIDPADTSALYEQAAADLMSAEARADQARLNAQLEQRNQATAVQNAEESLRVARIRLERAKLEAQTQPTISSASVKNARAALASQREAMRQLREVTIPQLRRSADAELDRSRAEHSAAVADLARQEELFKLGYVAQASVDAARTRAESAKASLALAEQRHATLERDIEAQIQLQQARLDQAVAALEQAEANVSQVDVAKRNLDEAQRNVQLAEIALQRAKDARLSVSAREEDVRTARAATVRSRVSKENAKVQLESTTVVAPRDGVVTLKYLEEGTIIPPGTSTFAQGTSLVQISDITTLFVECAVDEADIASVRKGQAVRVTVEAYPRARIEGVVDRVSPSAITTNNVTAVKVRVKINPGFREPLLPGMNATCEFLTLQKPDVLIVPSQAVKREGGKTIVKVKGPTPGQVVSREVELGDSGNDGYEVISGLKEGEEVVVAEIDLAQLRDIQQRMLDAQQGGGLAGAPGPRRPTQGGATRTNGGGGGGGRAPGGGR
jgi:HlyD family secretion protein